MAAAAGAGPPPIQVSQYIVKEGKEEIEARINELNLENIILLGWINFDKIQDYFNKKSNPIDDYCINKLGIK